MRPTYEVADVLNRNQHRLQDYCANSWQQRTLHALRKCRTAALGGHIDQCDHCGNLSLSYRRAARGLYSGTRGRTAPCAILPCGLYFAGYYQSAMSVRPGQSLSLAVQNGLVSDTKFCSRPQVSGR